MRSAILRAMTFAAALGGAIGLAAAAPCGNNFVRVQGMGIGLQVGGDGAGHLAGHCRRRAGRVKYSYATIKLDRNQGVFKQSFEKFSGRMIPPRLKRAKSQLAKNADTFARIEQQFGVPKEVVVAIWGLETDFGAVGSKNSVLSAVATLAYDCRRSDFFRGQLVDALRVIERGDLTPAQMVGGLHGEIGQTQFLPSSYVAFAVDFDGNGRADLIRSTADVLASTANYLRGKGWKKGGDWMPGSGNFAVIKEWNKSDVYSRTVAEFARRLKEG